MKNLTHSRITSLTIEIANVDKANGNRQMVSTKIVIGNTLRVTATFENVDSQQAFDPTDVRVTILESDGVSTTFIYVTDPEVVREDVGIYYIDIDLDKAGTWRYRWETTDANQLAAFENRIEVLASDVI